MDLVSIVSRAGVGAAAGISYALTGWAKAKGEKMDWYKLFKTGVLGALVGVTSEFTGVPIVSVETYTYSLGITTVLENGLKAAWRWMFGYTPTTK